MRRLHLIETIVALATLVGFACESGEMAAAGSGQHRLSASVVMSINDCSKPSPAREWQTDLRLGAPDQTGRRMVTETAYGCSFAATQQGAVLSATGVSCPINAAGFAREELQSFRWNLSSGAIDYVATLYPRNANSPEGRYCASVHGLTSN